MSIAHLANYSVYARLCALVIWLIVSYRLSYAEQLTIEGITISCPGCVNHADGRCTVVENGQPVVLECEQALDQLLQSSLIKESEVKVSVEGLFRYLYLERRAQEIATPIILQMIREEVGHQLILKNLERFLAWYSPSILELMLTGWIDDNYRDLKKLIFEEPEDGTSIRTELRIAAALMHPDLSLRDVSFQLGLTNINYELERLKVWTATAELLDHPWSGQFRRVYSMLENCRVIEEGIVFPAGCAAAQINKLGQPFSEYGNRYVMNALISQIEREMLDGLEVLRRFAQTDYINHRTEKTHHMVAEAIEDLLTNRRPIDGESILEDSVSSFLLLLGRNDPHISEKYLLLLLNLAATFWNDNRFELALKAIENSFVVSPSPFSAREKLLRRLSDENSLLSPADLAKFENLRSREKSGEVLLLLYLIVLVPTVLLSYLKRKKLLEIFRKVFSASKLVSSLSFNERYELKEVLAHFGLTMSATLEELGRAYRIRAKTLHPDSETGNIAQFNLLTARYQRARQLLQKSEER